MEPLPTPDEIHLWLAWPDRITDSGLLARYRALLSAEEMERHDRYRFDRHRHTFLVTRALVRTVLARYADRPAESLSFTKNRYGRPGIPAGENPAALNFNISHTDGLVALAVTRNATVGVDVESTGRTVMDRDLARRFFAPPEADRLAALPPAQQAPRFIAYWTLKEAFIKACGRGLSIPLSDFSFHLEEGHPITVSFAPSLAEDPPLWHFSLLDPGEGFRIAIARKTDRPAPPPRLLTRALVPLAQEIPHTAQTLFSS